MRTKLMGGRHHAVMRVGLVSVAAILVSACSSDADRLGFFGVDQAQPTPVTVVQPGMVQPGVAQPVYGQQQPIAAAPQPLSTPAPYTAPTYTAPGYPQTTASIGPVQVQAQPTVQALPQPVSQPAPYTVAQPTQVRTVQPQFAAQPQTITVTQRAPVASPSTHLAQTPGGMVGARVPVTTQVAQIQPVQPVAQQVVYQQPIIQPAPQPLTTASIGAPQPLAPDTITTSSISAPVATSQPLPPPQQLPSATRGPGWSAIGGTRVRVQPGETLFSMSRRYGVPVDALRSTNRLSNSSALRAGQEIIIPTYSATATAPSNLGVDTTVTGSTGAVRASRYGAPAPTPRPATLGRTIATLPQATTPAAPQAMPAAGTHVVASGETLFSIARRYNMTAQQLIAANGITDPNRIRIGQRLVVSSVPGAQSLPQVAAAPTQTPAQVVASRSYTPPRPATTETQLVQQTAAIQQVAARNDEISEQTPLQFRWPIRGRVLSEFGGTTNGVRNDGVNIAVPEGASVRAAEEGEIVYAGNELRGFGNLVLIQHRNGYVTAYAHNSRLDVQRGDRVSRGDVIARAGSTGDVDTPQLHFEIRRGTTPVDPSPYLPQG
ncbi:MAG: peptidoglycan DD-metalloendopeptidase family protein [Pseudomonadota bacterium]